jgi:hypothetical protein
LPHPCSRERHSVCYPVSIQPGVPTDQGADPVRHPIRPWTKRRVRAGGDPLVPTEQHTHL